MSLDPSPTTQHPVIARQLWDLPTASDSNIFPCPTFTFPPGGVLIVNPRSTLTFSTEAIYEPNCTAPASYLSVLLNSSSSIEDFRQPFYSSVTPLIFVVAATTILAWMLTIVVLVTPRTFRPTSSNTPSASTWAIDVVTTLFGHSSGPSNGSRPWLQKLAALLVSASLTAVTVDTFKSAEAQYGAGYMDAKQMRQDVTSGNDVRVIRLVSDFFLWLALVQTLTRLFPRRTEKMLIKWCGFLLICLDLVFSSLNSFVVDTEIVHPRDYQDAIPALSYLFQLSLNLLYGVWVFYYALTKRKYAFFSARMPSIAIIATISIISLLIPIVFFIVDVVQPAIGAWGDYFRWVGAASSSIVIWEWVDRIEMLESDEKKDGILGQEVYDGDELLFARSRGGDGTRHYNPGVGGVRLANEKLGGLKRRLTDRTKRNTEHRVRQLGTFRRKRRKSDVEDRSDDDLGRPEEPLTEPVDRALATSADTIYQVTYHQPIDTLPVDTSAQITFAEDGTRDEEEEQAQSKSRWASTLERGSRSLLAFKTRAFKKARSSPPVEIKKAMALEENRLHSEQCNGANTALPRKMSTQSSGEVSAKTTQKSTVIPIPPRGQTWSPTTLRHSPLSEVQNNTDGIEARLNAGPSSSHHDDHSANADADGIDDEVVDSRPTSANGESAEEPEVRHEPLQDTSDPNHETNGDIRERSRASRSDAPSNE